MTMIIIIMILMNNNNNSNNNSNSVVVVIIVTNDYPIVLPKTSSGYQLCFFARLQGMSRNRRLRLAADRVDLPISGTYPGDSGDSSAAWRDCRCGEWRAGWCCSFTFLFNHFWERLFQLTIFFEEAFQPPVRSVCSSSKDLGSVLRRFLWGFCCFMFRVSQLRAL